MQKLPKIPGWPIYETRGDPITIAGWQITPVGRVFQVRWPGGGFIRHRPLAVEIRQGDEVHRVPIPNTTQRIIAALMLAGLVVFAIGMAWMRRGNSQSRRRRRKS